MVYGAVRNAGAEVALDATLLARPLAGLTARLSGGWLRNRVADAPDQLRWTPAASAYQQPRIDQRLAEGMPLGTYVRTPYIVRDDDGDGLVGAGEVREYAGEAVTVGSSLPTRTATLELRARLGRRTTVRTLGEFRGGHVALGARPMLLLDGDRAGVDASASLDAQAALRSTAARTAALLDRADFVRLRELSVSHALGGRGAPVLTVAGRNLLTATGFAGTDPETTARPLQPLASGGYWIQPVPATLAVRLTLSR
jgi:hypothetical protein